MTKASRRQHSGPIFYLALAVVIYALISVAIAFATAGDCGNLRSEKRWVFVPPQWDCDSSLPGYQ